MINLFLVIITFNIVLIVFAKNAYPWNINLTKEFKNQITLRNWFNIIQKH